MSIKEMNIDSTHAQVVNNAFTGVYNGLFASFTAHVIKSGINVHVIIYSCKNLLILTFTGAFVHCKWQFMDVLNTHTVLFTVEYLTCGTDLLANIE